MGIFDVLEQTDEQKEQSKQLNQISYIQMLQTHNWELQQKVQMFDAEITRLRAENEKLREALKPFADYSDCLNEEEEETGNLAKEYDNQPVKIHYLRAAAAAIRESGDEPKIIRIIA